MKKKALKIGISPTESNPFKYCIINVQGLHYIDSVALFLINPPHLDVFCTSN